MNHLLVELHELCQHRLVLIISKVGPTRRKENLVFLLDVSGVKLGNGAELAGYVRQSGFVAIPVTGIRFNCLNLERECLPLSHDASGRHTCE